MFTIFFIFGSLIFLTFAWLGGCWYYFYVSEDIFTVPIDIFTAVSGAVFPVLMIWIMAGVSVTLFFLHRFLRIHVHIVAELRNVIEFSKMAELRNESHNITNWVPLLHTVMNNILADIMTDMELISPEDLNRLWRAAGSGDGEAIARDFIKRIKIQELRVRSLQNSELKAKLSSFCERYETLDFLLKKYDIYHVFGEIPVSSAYARIYAVFSGISIRKLLNRADGTADDISLSENVSGQNGEEEDTSFLEDLLSAKEKAAQVINNYHGEKDA